MNTRRAAQRGFTLLEVLVVVFIVGIIVGFATLSLGGRALDDRLQEEARRLLRLFNLAAEESMLTGQQIGWLYQERQYRFLVLSPEGWTPYGEGTPLRPRSLPEPMALELDVDELPVPTDPERVAPQILFLSSGEATPFALRLHAPDLTQGYVLRGEVTGQLSLARPES